MVDRQYNVYIERCEALAAALKIDDFGGMMPARSKCSAPIVLSQTHWVLQATWHSMLDVCSVKWLWETLHYFRLQYGKKKQHCYRELFT